MYSETFSVVDLSGERGGFVLFDSISFDLAPGGAMVLRGANGAGKSTLLRILAGLMPPADGAVHFGAEAAVPPARHYLGHANAIKTGLTVAQNVRFWADFSSESRERREDAADTAIEAFRLEALRDSPARYLSAGQKRRLALARLLASPAPLWLLDEPATALDRRSVSLLEQAVADHRRIGGLAILATHQDLIMPDALDLTLGET